MKYFWTILCLAAPVLAQGPAASETPGALTFHGSFRTRMEAWDWFQGNGNSDYLFSGNQLRLSLGQTWKRADWLVEMEAPVLLGLPTDSIAPGGQGALGLGANYTSTNDRSANAAMLFAKQAYFRFRSGRQSLRIGRFEFSDGTEMTPADPTVAWVKRERVSQRLIGPFGWSHVGRSFDGLHYTWGTPTTNLTVVGARPTRGAFQVDGWGELDVALGYAALTHARKTPLHNSDARLFGAYYQDWRYITKTDNRIAAARAVDRQNIRIATFGGHYAQGYNTTGGTVDLLLWGVLQTGRWGSLDHRANAVAVEGGWQPKVLPKLRPWLRAGYFRSNGDGNPSDNRHETFFQLLPTPRPYARTPFFNMMNNEDLMAMALVRPNKKITLRAEAHRLRLTEANDLWYTGGGAFQPWSFGYVGRSSSARRDLAALYDLSADYAVNAHWSVTAYFGHANGGDVIRAMYPGSKANFGYLELTTRF